MGLIGFNNINYISFLKGGVMQTSISKVSSFLDVIEREVLQTSIHWHLVTIVHFQIPKDMTLILSIG